MNDHHEGIQVEKPIPPWERPGCFRMDCELHRAGLLRLMGAASLTASFLSIPFPLPFLAIGLALCVITRLMARSDLAKMHKGLMDSGGMGLATEAQEAGLIGFVLNLLSVVVWGAVFLVLFQVVFFMKT